MKPKLLFSLSESSLKTWLPAFLHSSKFEAKAVFPISPEEIETEIERENPDCVIPIEPEQIRPYNSGSWRCSSGRRIALGAAMPGAGTGAHDSTR